MNKKKNILVTAVLLLSMAGANHLFAQYSQSLHIRGGLPNTARIIEEQGNLKIAWFGGSITNHSGYRTDSEEWLRRQFPDCEITGINAAVGGTGSDLGVFRMDDGVLTHNPDLVFIEFAVNDSGRDSLILCNSMEGIVRKIRKQLPDADMCFVYTVGKNMLEDLHSGRLPRSSRMMERIAEHYQIPSVNFGADLTWFIDHNLLVFSAPKGYVFEGKLVFSNDVCHPTFDVGHKIYTNTLAQSILVMLENSAKPSKKLPKPLYPTNFEKARTVSLDEVRISSGWKKVSPADHVYKYYSGSSVRFPDLRFSDDPSDSIVINFKGSVLGVFDVIGPETGGFTYRIDNEDPVPVKRFDSWCVNSYRSHYYLLPSMEDGMHRVVIKPDNTAFDKRIKNNKNLKIEDKSVYQEYKTFVGKILLIGELLSQ